MILKLIIPITLLQNNSKETVEFLENVLSSVEHVQKF